MRFKTVVLLQVALLLIMMCVPAVAGANTASITLSLSKTAAPVGDSVTASGTTAPGAWVPLKVIDGAKNILVFDAKKADASGNYSIDFIIPASASGTLTVVVGEGTEVAASNLTVESGPPAGTVAEPSAWPLGGAVVPGTQVTLESETAGADIYFTLDGSTPTRESTKYTGPITINGPVTIKAIAVKAGMNDSAVLTVSYTIAAPVNDSKVTVGESNKVLAITGDTPGSVEISVPDGVKDAAISVNALIKTSVSGTVTTAPLPELNIRSTDTSISSDPVQVSIPAGATISAPEGWNGTINVPTVKESSTVKVEADPGKTATVSTVIEIGYGDVPLTFDRAVRLLIPGQAGKDAGYYRNGVFTKIPGLPSNAQDNQSWADQNIPAGGDGKMDAGPDLVIWTKHFTKFVTYTQSSSGGPSDGQSGGSTTPQAVTSTTGSAMVTPGAGGTISLGDEAAIKIPAGALTGTSAVEVKIAKVSTPPAVPAGFRLLGDVYEFSVGGKNSYNFAKNVTITLSFDPGALGEGETPAIFYYDEAKGQGWVNLGGTVSGNTITVQVDHFTRFAVLAVKKDEQKVETFKDITGHWAKANIDKLVAIGAISGYPDGTFRPDNTITRAEFATVLVKAFKLENKGGKIFADTAYHWARDYIAAAAANGVVSGYDASMFGPDDLITREQMAVMIVKAAGLTPAAGEIRFADSGSISGWAGEAVATAVKNGIINGYPDNTFRPQGNATRAEAVTVIVNAL